MFCFDDRPAVEAGIGNPGSVVAIDEGRLPPHELAGCLNQKNSGCGL